MKYGILGTGDVAHAIATKLAELGHEVMMGARNATNEKAANWAKANGEWASHGTFADAARFGERVFNCVQGIHSLELIWQIRTSTRMGIFHSIRSGAEQPAWEKKPKNFYRTQKS